MHTCIHECIHTYVNAYMNAYIHIHAYMNHTLIHESYMHAAARHRKRGLERPRPYVGKSLQARPSKQVDIQAAREITTNPTQGHSKWSTGVCSDTLTEYLSAGVWTVCDTKWSIHPRTQECRSKTNQQHTTARKRTSAQRKCDDVMDTETTNQTSTMIVTTPTAQSSCVKSSQSHSQTSERRGGSPVP
jgi:hypothetical protein